MHKGNLTSAKENEVPGVIGRTANDWSKIERDREELLRALETCREFAERYTQFASLHDDGEERLYAANLERSLSAALAKARG